MEFIAKAGGEVLNQAGQAIQQNFTSGGNYSRRGRRHWKRNSGEFKTKKEDGMWIGFTMLFVFIIMYLASRYMFSASDESFERVLAAHGEEGRKYLEKKYRVDLSKYVKKGKKKAARSKSRSKKKPSK